MVTPTVVPVVRLVLVVGLLAVPAAPAESLLCKKRNGALVVRDSCKRKETILDPAAVGGGPKGDAGAAGITQPRVRVVDANGTRLPGVLNGSGHFIYDLGSQPLRLPLLAGGLQQRGSFYFAGASCTGASFVSGGGSEFFETASVVGTTAYYAGDPIQDRTMQSQRYTTSALSCANAGGTYDATAGFCCVNGAATVRSGPAAALDLSGFMPPFRAELEP
jgi:hypothetical protein